jgi:HlyD family secretion protein
MNGTVKAMFFTATGMLIGAAAMSLPKLAEVLSPEQPVVIPTTKVKRGDVAFSVTANGQLQGGNSKMLTAPMTGSYQLVLTELLKSGDVVKTGDVVAQFDITDESFRLREAEADVAEADQYVLQVRWDALAREEELTYELIRARGNLKLAELDMESNSLRSAIAAKQYTITLEGAKHLLDKLERDYPDRKASTKASVAIQEAARERSKMLAETARRNIETMTLKAPSDGYINVERNVNINYYSAAAAMTPYQMGDQVRAGMAVAQIPDLTNWEVIAQIAEQDRGHLSVAQPSDVRVIALPGKKFHGHITSLGGTTGPPWDRRVECKLSLDDPVHDLRPGMSARIVITMETLKKALWLPAQAVFERDGRTFVYSKSDSGFLVKDVQLVRRSESQVALKGLKEGDEIALASPDQKEKKKSGGTDNAAKVVGK